MEDWAARAWATLLSNRLAILIVCSVFANLSYFAMMEQANRGAPEEEKFYYWRAESLRLVSKHRELYPRSYLRILFSLSFACILAILASFL